MDRHDPSHPETYPRRALVAALGLAPQIVTETLWALSVQQGWHATELHLVTTVEGAAMARAVLMGEGGSLAALWAALKRPLPLPPVTVHVIGGSSPLNDIDSAADNAMAADLFARVIRDLANDGACAIHVSIAGGRKTMGFLAGYALSLFGRRQDRLSHVLVPLAFQNLPDFHFPPVEPRQVSGASGQPMSSTDATLVLADIPFVRLRASQSAALLSGSLSFLQAVTIVQDALKAPVLRIVVHERRLECGGTSVTLTPINLAFAIWLARRCRDHGPEAGAARWNQGFWNELAGEYRRLNCTLPSATKVGAGDIDEFYFRERVSRVNRTLREALGPNSEPFALRQFGKRPHIRNGFALSPENITLIEV